MAAGGSERAVIDVAGKYGGQRPRRSQGDVAETVAHFRKAFI
jgi:hypothetical protein